MPGKRRAGKKVVNVWLTEKEKAVLTETYKRLGFPNLAEFLRSHIPMEPTQPAEVETIKTLAPEDRSKVVEAAEKLGYTVEEFMEDAALRVAEQLNNEYKTKRKAPKKTK